MNTLGTTSEQRTSVHVFDLVSLIQASVVDIVAEYKAAGTSVPSLDSPTEGPFDAPEKAGAKLLKAIYVVEAACAQLCATVASPALSLTNKAFAFEECASLQVVCEAKIADYLADKPEGVPVSELAEKAAVDSDKLARILRLLATKHVFREVKPNVFANNRLSAKLVSDNTARDYIRLATSICFKPAPLMYETLADRSAAAPETCFRRLHGKPMFNHLNSPDGKEDAEIFAKGMIGGGDITGKNTLIKAYPWQSLSKSAGPIIICDVGGGNGHVSMELMRAFPHHPFNVVVQDMSSMIEQGKALWSKEMPEAVRNKRVELKTIDFFKEAPVGGCDFYYLRHVIHNWSDEKCVQILSNIASAMRTSPERRETTRLLIHDLVMLYALSADSDYAPPGIEIAPAPLLKNYGVGRVRAYNNDVNMLCCLGQAKERTVEEFVALGYRAGLAFVHAWDAGATLEFILEFKLA